MFIIDSHISHHRSIAQKQNQSDDIAINIAAVLIPAILALKIRLVLLPRRYLSCELVNAILSVWVRLHAGLPHARMQTNRLQGQARVSSPPTTHIDGDARRPANNARLASKDLIIIIRANLQKRDTEHVMEKCKEE